MSSSVSTGGSDDPILIAFDVECTGSDFMKHAMVELGAAAYRYERHPVPIEDRSVANPNFRPDKHARKIRMPFKPIGVFETIMHVPDGRGWDERCVREFWDNPDRSEHEQLKAKKKKIETSRISPEDGMKFFVTWVEQVVTKTGGDPSRIRFISDNAAYDAAWVGLYLCQYANHLPLTVFFDDKFQAIIDTSSYHQGLSRLDHVMERKIKAAKGHYSEDRECRKVLSVPDDFVTNATHDHNAMHDAQEIAEQHLIILQFMI